MTRAERLLASLEAHDPQVAEYTTPLGPQPRTSAAVCRAMARLRDPDERIQHELWWEAPERGLMPATTPTRSTADAAWGWRSR